MLDGNELEGKISDVGSYAVDVDAKGNLKISLTVEKDFGSGKVSSVTSLEASIFKIAEQIAKKTLTDWDDKAISVLEELLGIEK